MSEKKLDIQFDGEYYCVVDGERCLARLDTRIDARAWLEMYHLMLGENEQLKQEIKELKEELIEYIEQTSSDKSNKKGFVGNGRFA